MNKLLLLIVLLLIALANPVYAKENKAADSAESILAVSYTHLDVYKRQT